MAGAADRIEELLQEKIAQGGLDVPGAKVIGVSVTLPG